MTTSRPSRQPTRESRDEPLRPGSLLSPRGGKRNWLLDGHPIVVQALLAMLLILLAWSFTDTPALSGFSDNPADVPGGSMTLLVSISAILFAGMALICHHWPHVRVLCGIVTGAVFALRLLQFQSIARQVTLGLPANHGDPRLVYAGGFVASIAFIVWGWAPSLMALRRTGLRPRAGAVTPRPRAARGPENDSLLQWIEILQEGAPQERQHAAEALGSVGPPAQEAVAPLVRALKDPEERVRQAAADALGRIVVA